MAKSVGAAIKARREAAGLSQSAVAQRAGIHAAMLSRIERDERADPYFSTVAKVAAVLGVSLDDIAADAGFVKPTKRKASATSDAGAALRLDGELGEVSRMLDRARTRLDRARSTAMG